MTEKDRRNELFAAHWVKAQPAVLTYLLTLIRSVADAEDVLQTVAIKVASHIDAYDPSRPFLKWVMTIARNEAIDHLRRTRRDRLVFAADLIETLSDDVESLTDGMTRRKAALESCVGELAERSQRLLAMRYRQELPIDAMAQQLGMKPNAVYVTLHRIRQALARCIEGRIAAVGEDS